MGFRAESEHSLQTKIDFAGNPADFRAQSLRGQVPFDGAVSRGSPPYFE